MFRDVNRQSKTHTLQPPVQGAVVCKGIAIRNVRASVMQRSGVSQEPADALVYCRVARVIYSHWLGPSI